MQLNVVHQKTNRLLKREEIEFEVTGMASTPGRKELRQKIADHLNVKPDVIAIQRIEQLFGTQANKARVHVYENPEQLNKTELAHLVGRDKGEKKKPVKKEKKVKSK